MYRLRYKHNEMLLTHSIVEAKEMVELIVRNRVGYMTECFTLTDIYSGVDITYKLKA